MTKNLFRTDDKNRVCHSCEGRNPVVKGLDSRLRHAGMTKMILIAGVFLIMFSFAGCQEKIDNPRPSEKPLTQAEPPKSKEPLSQEAPRLETLPVATLTAVKINEDYTNNMTWIDIGASETFRYNIVQKGDPGHIIIVIHNTKKGKAPAKIAVKNGTINEVEIDELTTGQGSAVRITIWLTRKTVYGVHPSQGTLRINIPREA